MNTTPQGNGKYRILIISPWKRQWSAGKGAGVADDYRFSKRLTERGFELHFLSPRSGTSPEFSFENLFNHTYSNFFDAMEKWPGSRRALAREIGLTHATLNDISAGRIRATPGTAKRILAALEDRASVLSESADRIRRALITIEEE